jgi:hypothetical protein
MFQAVQTQKHYASFATGAKIWFEPPLAPPQLSRGVSHFLSHMQNEFPVLLVRSAQ